MDPLEIDIEKAKELAKSGNTVEVFVQSHGDVELLKDVLETVNVKEVNPGDARSIIMGLDDEDSLKQLAKKYSGSIIICPHGNTSLRFAKALSRLGIESYSLNGGISKITGRP